MNYEIFKMVDVLSESIKGEKTRSVHEVHLINAINLLYLAAKYRMDGDYEDAKDLYRSYKKEVKWLQKRRN